MSRGADRYNREYVLGRLKKATGVHLVPGRRWRDGADVKYTLLWEGYEVGYWNASLAFDCMSYENPDVFEQYIDRVAHHIRENLALLGA
jgi:hypothetical protein